MFKLNDEKKRPHVFEVGDNELSFKSQSNGYFNHLEREKILIWQNVVRTTWEKPEDKFLFKFHEYVTICIFLHFKKCLNLAGLRVRTAWGCGLTYETNVVFNETATTILTKKGTGYSAIAPKYMYSSKFNMICNFNFFFVAVQYTRNHDSLLAFYWMVWCYRYLDSSMFWLFLRMKYCTHCFLCYLKTLLQETQHSGRTEETKGHWLRPHLAS